MLNPLFDITPLKDHIATGGLVLTANRRLARSLLAAWGQHCQTQGAEVWPQPPVRQPTVAKAQDGRVDYPRNR